MSRPIVLDVCCGCGGLSLGARRVWGDAFAFVGLDSSAPCVSLYSSKFGEAHQVNIKDEHAVDAAIAGRPVFALIGGPPCQPFSVASRTKMGEQNDRNLIDSFVAIAARLRPEVVVMEEVPTIASKYKHVLKRVIDILEKNGYVVRCGVYDMSWHGLPQMRRRLFIRASRAGELLPIARDTSRTTLTAAHFDRLMPPEANEAGLLVPTHVIDRIGRFEGNNRFYKNSTRDLRIGQPCYTVTCNNGRKTNLMLRIRIDDAGNITSEKGPMEPPPREPRRMLTFDELESIQTLPRGWTAGFPKTTRTRMIGNAVPPQFAEIVFRSMQFV